MATKKKPAAKKEVKFETSVDTIQKVKFEELDTYDPDGRFADGEEEWCFSNPSCDLPQTEYIHVQAPCGDSVVCRRDRLRVLAQFILDNI